LENAERVLAELLLAHREHMVFRDISAGSILVGPAGRITSINWGAALEESEAAPLDAAPSIPVFRTYGGGGYTLYAAPEAFRGEVGPPSDVYAAGLLLYEMLVGAPPFRGTVVQAARDRVQNDVPAPSRAPGAWWIPPALDSLVAELTQRDPAARPTADAALDRVRHTRAVLAAEGLFSPTIAGGEAADTDHGAAGPQDQPRAETKAAGRHTEGNIR